MQEIEELKLCPAVGSYGPSNIRGLQAGQTKLWCTCGLSKKQPWCDNSHTGTAFKPLKWTVPKTQTMFAICNCKYSSDPPFCDGVHMNLPLKILEQQSKCKERHDKFQKICSSCGYTPEQ